MNLSKCLTQSVYTESSSTFCQINCPAILGAILNFCIKCKKRIYLGNGARQSEFDKMFDPQGVCRLISISPPPFFWCHLKFLPFFFRQMNFCINAKTYYTGPGTHFSKIINAHWNTLFLLYRNNFFFSCKGML